MLLWGANMNCKQLLPECKAWCCKQFVIKINRVLSLDMVRYYNYHNVDVLLHDDSSELVINMRCSKLTEQNTCSVHGKASQPEFCKGFKCNLLKSYDTKIKVPGEKDHEVRAGPGQNCSEEKKK